MSNWGRGQSQELGSRLLFRTDTVDEKRGTVQFIFR